MFERSPTPTPERTPAWRAACLAYREQRRAGASDLAAWRAAVAALQAIWPLSDKAAAREWYGVVMGADGEADGAASAALRGKLASARIRLCVVADDSQDPYVGLKGRHRTLALSAADAGRLSVSNDALVEMFGSNPAPLRAWIRIDAVTEGTVSMNSFGRQVLGIAERDSIHIRAVATPRVPKGLAGIG